MARRHHQVGRYVASETEPDGVGQRKLEEVDETGIGRLRALSPWLLMMMMMTVDDQGGLSLDIDSCRIRFYVENRCSIRLRHTIYLENGTLCRPCPLALVIASEILSFGSDK